MNEKRCWLNLAAIVTIIGIILLIETVLISELIPDFFLHLIFYFSFASCYYWYSIICTNQILLLETVFKCLEIFSRHFLFIFPLAYCSF